MAETKTETHETHLPERAEEARDLAIEAMEERRHGNKEEADFLLNEAKQLDPEAAAAVVKQDKA